VRKTAGQVAHAYTSLTLTILPHEVTITGEGGGRFRTVDRVGDNRAVTTSSRRARADLTCREAVDEARTALLESVDAGDVGDHLGYEIEGERTLSHQFDCLRTGYREWRWSVVVTRASRQRAVTVNEIVLLPGPGAVVAPEWVPYRERVQPDDLGPGDLLPPDEDDPRLVPAWLSGDEATDGLVDDASVRPVADEIGLGRSRVLSLDGRDSAAQRWYDGTQGPETEHAQAAPAPCRTCGFLLPIAGPLATVFGVCANESAPDDGRVVAFDHGCGAHSEAAPVRKPRATELPPPVFDTLGADELTVF
jgi:hypothetical protein